MAENPRENPRSGHPTLRDLIPAVAVRGYAPPMALKSHERGFSGVLVGKANETYETFARAFYKKILYRYLTHRLAPDDVVFLNYGYEEDPPMGVPLSPADEHNRFFIQLYHRTATQVDLNGKHVLEVGCGHGGGASYLTRALHPAAYTGLDLNSAGIAFCRERHKVAGLNFVEGDAEQLPFPDESFDAVINIESSHLYAQFPQFLAEVARVLRPGGHLLYADFRFAGGIATWEAQLADAPMRMLSQRLINAEVARGMENNSHWWVAVMNAVVPAFAHSFALVPSYQRVWKTHQSLQDGGPTEYRLYCFQKA